MRVLERLEPGIGFDLIKSCSLRCVAREHAIEPTLGIGGQHLGLVDCLLDIERNVLCLGLGAKWICACGDEEECGT